MCWLGEFALARAHFEQSLALYGSQQHRLHVGLEPGVVCLSYTAWVLWQLGYPDQSLRKIHEAFTLTQKISHPLTLAFVLICAGILHQLRREVQATRERAEAVIALSGEQGFPQFLAWGRVWRGWALAEQGQGEEGITQIHQGMAAYRATGGGSTWPYCLARLAEAYGKVRQGEEGVRVLAEALAMVEKTGEHFYEAELHRLKGELTLKQSSVSRPQSAIRNRRPKRVFTRPLRLHADRARSRWSCGRQ